MSEEAAFSEEDLLPLSALQHFIYCRRRAALVHTERSWGDNRYTAEGSILHRRADLTGTEARGDLRIARGLRLRSLRLGLSGLADVVEFQQASEGIELPGASGRWRPVPVEYKRGRLRREAGYLVQLCAQALCLEEMLKVEICSGCIYFGKTRRRLSVEFDRQLRRETESAASQLHALIRSLQIPKAVYGPKCDRCSLFDVCLPKAPSSGRAVERYLKRCLAASPAPERGSP